MSQSCSLWNRTTGALAGVAVDAIRDLTVERLDRVAEGLHRRLHTTAHPAMASASAAEPVASQRAVPAMASATVSATMAGVLFGIGVAVLLVSRR